MGSLRGTWCNTRVTTTTSISTAYPIQPTAIITNCDITPTSTIVMVPLTSLPQGPKEASRPQSLPRVNLYTIQLAGGMHDYPALQAGRNPNAETYMTFRGLKQP